MKQKTLTALGWYSPYENLFDLSYRQEPIAPMDSGYTVQEATDKARQLGYTRLKVNHSMRNTYFINV